MKIKICGLHRPQDIDYVNEAQPDYVGFVFAPSKRQVNVAQAHDLKRRLSPHMTVVGVFVDQDIRMVNSLLVAGIIHLAQLHGHEDDHYLSQVKGQTIKGIRPGENTDRPADYLLFDSPVAGSGLTFDWSKLPKTNKPFFLAGGINKDNLPQAVMLRPYAIDISSGVETEGVKDRAKILEIVKLCQEL